MTATLLLPVSLGDPKQSKQWIKEVAKVWHYIWETETWNDLILLLNIDVPTGVSLGSPSDLGEFKNTGYLAGRRNFPYDHSSC